MSSVGLSGTSATLMWVAEHSAKVNETKRGRMEEADARTDQVEDLNLLKEKLSIAKQSGSVADINVAKSAIDDFLKEHAGDENIEELKNQLGEVSKNLGTLVEPGLEPDASDKNKYPEDDKGKESYKTDKTNWDKKKADWDKGIEDRMKTIDGLAQSIGQRDQIEMMHITTLDQAENRFYELGSNKIANDGKTANTLIGNMRV